MVPRTVSLFASCVLIKDTFLFIELWHLNLFESFELWHHTSYSYIFFRSQEILRILKRLTYNLLLNPTIKHRYPTLQSNTAENCWYKWRKYGVGSYHRFRHTLLDSPLLTGAVQPQPQETLAWTTHPAHRQTQLSQLHALFKYQWCHHFRFSFVNCSGEGPPTLLLHTTMLKILKAFFDTSYNFTQKVKSLKLYTVS